MTSLSQRDPRFCVELPNLSPGVHGFMHSIKGCSQRHFSTFSLSFKDKDSQATITFSRGWAMTAPIFLPVQISLKRSDYFPLDTAMCRWQVLFNSWKPSGLKEMLFFFFFLFDPCKLFWDYTFDQIVWNRRWYSVYTKETSRDETLKAKYPLAYIFLCTTDVSFNLSDCKVSVTSSMWRYQKSIKLYLSSSNLSKNVLTIMSTTCCPQRLKITSTYFYYSVIRTALCDVREPYLKYKPAIRFKTECSQLTNYIFRGMKQKW